MPSPSSPAGGLPGLAPGRSLFLSGLIIIPAILFLMGMLPWWGRGGVPSASASPDLPSAPPPPPPMLVLGRTWMSSPRSGKDRSALSACGGISKLRLPADPR